MIEVGKHDELFLVVVVYEEVNNLIVEFPSLY